MPRLRRQAARCTNRRTDRQIVRFRFLLRQEPVRQVRQRVRRQLHWLFPQQVRKRRCRFRRSACRWQKRRLLGGRIRQRFPMRQYLQRVRVGVLSPKPEFRTLRVWVRVERPVFPLLLRARQLLLQVFQPVFRQVSLSVSLPLPVWTVQTAWMRFRLWVSPFAAWVVPL